MKSFEITRNIPRMETINKAAEITGLSKHFIRQKAVNGEIVCVKAGNKYLINVDRLIEYLNNGHTLKPAPPVSESGIKPIPVKL
ncbi:MAG: helix-turn-helix domain-containing protein [Ruminococcus sp.]|nr:helix-turn-helix domain-containing protein [Ruminococcus sp.]